MSLEKKKADANPTKAFFVRMITRDISLQDCILDLIDNSIDGAWKLEGSMPMSLTDGADLSKYRIIIDIRPDSFSIRDNCGGITLDEAADYAFTFGRKDKDEPEKYSIGVYGIGMKRAVFKMGRSITVRSSYTQDSQRHSFEVPINVPKWLQDTRRDWDFDIRNSKIMSEDGVEIVVQDLNEGSAESFKNPSFIQELKRVIGRDYALHMRRGLSILLNGMAVKAWNIEVMGGGSVEPMRINYAQNGDVGPIKVEIVAGMAAPPPENSDPEDTPSGENLSGWYVACNGRIVLAADKTEISGWGSEGWPQWHPQYSGFIGIILFSSENAALLPITTTKRSVDTSSVVYRRARPQMRDVSREWIAYTNARKHSLDEAKRFEQEAKPVSIFEIPQRSTISFPTLTPKPKVKSANIAYAMPLERVKALAKGFGDINMSNREVGIKSFEHAYGDFAEDE